MIGVPYMKKPAGCDVCPFGVLKYATYGDDGVHAYNCKVEFYEKGKFKQLVEAPVDSNAECLSCPLIEYPDPIVDDTV